MTVLTSEKPRDIYTIRKNSLEKCQKKLTVRQWLWGMCAEKLVDHSNRANRLWLGVFGSMSLTVLFCLVISDQL
jgi:hypothetical protein